MPGGQHLKPSEIPVMLNAILEDSLFMKDDQQAKSQRKTNPTGGSLKTQKQESSSASPATASSPTKYVLEVSEYQASVISQALEFMTRCCMGQFDSELWYVCFQDQRRSDEADALLRRIKKIYTGHESNAYWSLTSEEVPEKARIAWDIHATIRHRLSWDRNPQGGYTVNFDEPMRTAREESIPKIKRVKGE